MKAAIYYHPEAYSTTGPKLMGRNAAGESFLKGYLLHSQASEYWLQVQNKDHVSSFAEKAAELGRTRPIRFVDARSLSSIKEAGVVFHPGPGIAEHAQIRAIVNNNNSSSHHNAWSLCGITHTTSSAGAMDAIAQIITAPVQPWDALICTSSAVKDNVEKVLQAQVDNLRARLGISNLVLPQLPVIPLGIHTSDFEFSSETKAASRAEIGANHSDIVVLFMGRLSFHAKAHPLAMYQALEAAALKTNQNIILIECGWFGNDHIQKAYEEAAKMCCPSVRVITLDGKNPKARNLAWASADVFCSLSDNIQETFGIVPIEAMAASLPVVVSDWDGYKDTVRHGVEGFRVPTIMPQAGLATDLAARHALGIDNYDMYCGHTSSLVAVDIEACTNSLIELINSPELRAIMGSKGRTRAKEVFDWSKIIPRYQALWSELNLIRESSLAKHSSSAKEHPWPARLDPFYAFASYPTEVLGPNTKFAIAGSTSAEVINRLQQLMKLKMVNYAKHVIPQEQTLISIINKIGTEPKTALEAVSNIPTDQQARSLRSIAWLAKLGLLKVI